MLNPFQKSASFTMLHPKLHLAFFLFNPTSQLKSHALLSMNLMILQDLLYSSGNLHWSSQFYVWVEQAICPCQYFLAVVDLSCLTFHDAMCRNIRFAFQMPNSLCFPLAQCADDYLCFTFLKIQQAIFSCLIRAKFKLFVEHVLLLIRLILLAKYQALHLFQNIHSSSLTQILHDKLQFFVGLCLFPRVRAAPASLFHAHKIVLIMLNFLLTSFVMF